MCGGKKMSISVVIGGLCGVIMVFFIGYNIYDNFFQKDTPEEMTGNDEKGSR